MIDKYQAVLLGYAIGDALAAPAEDMTPESEIGSKKITDYFKALPSHPVSHLEPGQYSDETQLMIVVAESLIACRTFNVDDLVHRFVDWFQSQKLRSAWRFPSNSMMKACRKLAAGTHWTQAGFPSAGIIAVVRTVPIALALGRSTALLKDAIEKSCKVTHTDPKVVAAAMVLATAIKFGLDGNEPSPDIVINYVIEKTQGYSPEVLKRMKMLKDALKLDPGPALLTLGNSGYCFEALNAAFYWFFRFPRRFDDLIVEAANSGGDSDSITAMAGALFGAYNGLPAIPEKWLTPLENREKIQQLASDIYRLAIPPR